MNEFAVIALTAILSSNIVASLGVGAVSLQSEKRNFLYMLVSSLCTIVSVIVAGLVTWILSYYVLIPLKALQLRLFIGVLLSISMAFASRAVLKLAFKEQYYLYEKSYGLPIQTAVTVGTLLAVNMTRSFLFVMFELAMFSVGYMLVQLLFYPLYTKLDNTGNLKPARNVPLVLVVLGVVGIILYAISMFF